MWNCLDIALGNVRRVCGERVRGELSETLLRSEVACVHFVLEYSRDARREKVEVGDGVNDRNGEPPTGPTNLGEGVFALVGIFCSRGTFGRRSMFGRGGM